MQAYKQELESKTIGNLQLSRGYLMEGAVICKVTGEGEREVTRPLARLRQGRSEPSS